MSLEVTRKYLNAYLKGKDRIHSSEEAGVRALVKAWFKAYKKWEFDDLFLTALKEKRMSIRQGPASQTYKANFKAGIPGKKGNSPYPGHQYSVGVDSLKDRLDPENFSDFSAIDRAERLKYKKGLHDLSASLLSPMKPSITKQLRWKFSGGKLDEWIVIFMPLPQPQDLALFHQLNTFAKQSSVECPGLYEDLGDIRSKMTRVKLAAPVDIGAGLKNIAPKEQSPHFSYGLKEPLDEQGNLTGIDQARYELAMEYTDIPHLQTGNSNEIVIAYRQHASTRFPIFAQWNGDQECFVCIEEEESTKSIVGGIIPDEWARTQQVAGN